MPRHFIYTSGQVLLLRATVVEGHDVGNPIIDLGGLSLSVPVVNLDRADTRPDSDRPKTEEEIDRKELAKTQDEAQVAKEKVAAELEAADIAAGQKILDEAGEKTEEGSDPPKVDG
jgi:hypothetical protein